MPGETVAGYLARRTGRARPPRRWRPPPRRWAPAPAEPTTPTPSRWTAGWPAARPTSTIASGPVLADLGLAVGAGRPMASLSGGQAARVALAALLLSRFDVVLLDEPTNDLDLDGLERLEAFVRGLRGGVVLVSHDREFLARCVTRIVELDLAQHQVAVYDGGYDAFLEERAVARRHAREAYDEFADKKADLVGAGADPARVELAGRAQRDEEEPRQRQDPAQGATPSRRRSRRRRCARWSPGSPGSRRSRSRARSGCCSSASAPRRGRARWSPP